jgi:ATP-binding cassette subfamily B protein
MKNQTRKYIDKRLQTIPHPYSIKDLQNGEIIESGNHRQLMKNGKLYSKLYNLNYASFDDIPEDVLEETATNASAT